MPISENEFEVANRELDRYVNAGYPSKVSISTISSSLTTCWYSPHSAMEVLLVAAKVYPLIVANRLVNSVVSGWQRKSDYSWKAGGSADHCFLAALALTGNGALADRDLFQEKREVVLSLYSDVPGMQGTYEMQDSEAKVALLRHFIETGFPVGIEGCYEATDFQSTCQLIIPDFEQVNAELIAYFSRHPERLQELHWRKFEELLDAIFRNQGYLTDLGPGSGDGGVDLRLIKKDSIGEVLTLVQAKRYRAANPVDLQAVQALYGVVGDQHAHRGLFVTTSRYLPVAQDFAQRQNGRLVLANSKDVAAWCKSVTRAT